MSNTTVKFKLGNAAQLSNTPNRKAAKRYFLRFVRKSIQANRASMPELAHLWPDITIGQWVQAHRGSHAPWGMR